ncbi:serine hydrolase domain-containing protein [Acidobacteriota bacterium]
MKFNKTLGFLLFFIILIHSFHPAVGAVKKDKALISQAIEEIEEQAPGWFKERDVPGMAIAIVDEEKILWHQEYGFTDRTKEKPIDPETIFSIQSMSKSFTAMGVLMAVQDGLLDLDEPITSYLPEFTVNSIHEKHPEDKMTLRLLLAHRAGFTHEAPLGGNYDCRPHTFEQHVISISDSWLRFPVGYRYSYSNLGIDLAGYILQKVSRQKFWDYIKAKVLIPLGMNSSSLDFDEIEKVENRAIGHDMPRAKIPGGIPLVIPMIPAGGVYTNILDMAEYMRFHINKGQVAGKQLLRKDLIKDMHSVQFPEKNQKSGYGLCLVRSEVSDTYLLNHGGGGYGFITSMTMYPELKLGVVTLTNANQSQVHSGRVQNIVTRLLVEKFGPTQVLPIDFDESGFKPVPDGKKRIKHLFGSYESGAILGNENDVVGIRLNGRFYPLTLYSEKEGMVGKFGQNSELRFKPSIQGRPGALVTLNRTTGSCSFYEFLQPEKTEDKPGPDKPGWKKYQGLYGYLVWGRQGGRVLRIDIRNGHLHVNGERCLEHVSKNGLFFTYTGEALDFRGTIPTFRNIMMFRRTW